MRIIFSPAKKMVSREEYLPSVSIPFFIKQTEILLDALQDLTFEQMKAIWKCSDRLASENWERLQQLDLYNQLSPALMSYEGIAYRYMAPNVFSKMEFDYIDAHLRILSGFYGVLKPMDGIRPYRLEMGAKLPVRNCSNLYQFWNSQLAEHLGKETNVIINLASKEYSKVVEAYRPSHVKMITCVFVQRKGNMLVEQSTACKMARGDMVRFLAEQRVEDPAEIRRYDRMHYRYVPEESSALSYVFMREA